MILTGGILFFVACNKDQEKVLPIVSLKDTMEEGPTPYTLIRPMGFPVAFQSSNNPLTVEGIALGRSLYADPILSSNGLSCSSCHLKNLSYSTPVFDAQNGYRKSVPPHVNLAFKQYYNWTGSVTDLDTLCMGDFESEFFNTNEYELFRRLSIHPGYPSMFKEAFGVSNIDSLPYYRLKTYICYAISQYMRTLISANSRYDSARLSFIELTYDEYAGMMIFFSEKGDCFHCHSSPLFTDNSFHNNGLNDQYYGFDRGRSLVTGQEKDMGKFFTPTLRNIALTAPYMHDGRFATLEEVIDFYNSGVKPSPYIDPIMNKRQDIRALNLTSYEKQQLLAFLKTLTDESFVK